ncbi:YVTN repeat-like/Quino protein amine dehydrogenase [Suillus decipiens]|nr:YVTN repeat-like/Quino protein amine dehydrogenase [Suillus decipiens]
MPFRKIDVKHRISRILHLPGGQRVVIYLWLEGLFQVWDLERGTQVGNEWKDEYAKFVATMALSPDGKTVATGGRDDAVRLWSIDMGKVVRTLAGHTDEVIYVRWHPDGRIWDVQSKETIIGPIKIGSPVGNIVIKIWDANTGELLKTIDQVLCLCLAWTLDGKTLFADGFKIDTATWTVLDVRPNFLSISLSPNDRILTTTKFGDKTVELWNTETNQSIGTLLHHKHHVSCATFSADGKFLFTACDDHLYTWDVSAIIKEAVLPSDIVDVTPRPALKIKGAPRIPPGFFTDALREANLPIHLSQSHEPHNHSTLVLHRRILTPSSFWRHSKRANEHDTQQNRSDIQLQEVEVPYTAGKPRNYHARKKAASSSRPANTHTTHPNAAIQSTPPSSHVQQPSLTATASSHLAVTSTAPMAGTISSPRITVAGWRTHLVGWLCCVPIQNTNNQVV